MKMCCFGKPKFLNELFQKLKSRRSEDDVGLAGAVSSPAKGAPDDSSKHKNGHDSKESIDSSMYSSEEELENKNLFNQAWAVGNTSRQSMMTDSSEQLDLNAVGSTVSLTSNFAIHKITIKPKNVRPSTKHRRPTKSPAKPLAQVEEREEAKGEHNEDSARPESMVLTSDEETGEENAKREATAEMQVKADVEAISEQKRQSAESSKDADEKDEVVEPEEAEAAEAKPALVIITKADTKDFPRTSPVPPQKPQKQAIEAEQQKASEPEKAPVPEEKKVPEEKEVKPSEEMPAKDMAGANKPFNVVLRKTGRISAIEDTGTIRMRKNLVERDSSKRQTVAGDAGLTSIFGEWKPGNRNSFVEPSRSGDESGNNEYSEVLNRLRKQSSRKKLILGTDEKAKPAESEKSVERKPNKASKEQVVVVEQKSKVLETKPKEQESKSKAVGSVTPQKATEGKPKVPEGKPKVLENKPQISESKSKINSKPKVVEVKPKTSESKSVPEHSPKSTEFKSDDGKTKSIVTISKSPEVSKPMTPDPVKTTTPDVSKPKTQESSTSKSQKKEVAVLTKPEAVVSPKEAEVKKTSTVLTPSEPIVEKKPLKVESKPSTTSTTTTTTTTTSTSAITATPVKAQSTKPVIIEKAKSVEQPKNTTVVEKPEPKTPVKGEAKVAGKSSVKHEPAAVKNRVRSQTLTEPIVQGANKENEKSSVQSIQRSNSQGDTINERPAMPAEKPSDTGPTMRGEPVWFTIARRKTANWDQKEKDLEQKEKKETSNIAEKERDASSKGKEVTLTINEAAKEGTKPTLRAPVKCANSAANRQSKVLDMAKLFNKVS